MKSWAWKPEKNEKLKEMGRPTFEEVLVALENGGFRDILINPGYPNQKILVVIIEEYAHAVPFKETKETFFYSRCIHRELFKNVKETNRNEKEKTCIQTQ